MTNLRTIITILTALITFVASSAEAKKWTVMVYMGADNDLEPFAITDLNEMEVVGSTTNFDVVVQLDRHPGWDTSNGDWRSTRRYLVKKDTNPNVIGSQLIMELGERNMGDPIVLREFVSWAIANYPSEKYLLIIWDHGTGWHREVISRIGIDSALTSAAESLSSRTEFALGQGAADVLQFPPSPFGSEFSKALCADETDFSDILFNHEINEALSTIPKLDILGFDACFMGMIEVAYQFQGEASYIVGSEELEPGDGWEYDLVLASLATNPNMTASQFSIKLVESYQSAALMNPATNQTLAAIDMSKIPMVVQRTSEFATALMSSGKWTDIKANLGAAERFGKTQPFYDLYDLARIAKLHVTVPAVQSSATNLQNSIVSAVIREFHESDNFYARGLAIYFPQSSWSYEFAYELSGVYFGDETNWPQFLRFYWFGPSAIINDIPEPNDAYTQAGLPLDPAYVYSSYLPTSSDRDWWLVNSGLPGNLSIRVAVPDDADFDLFLYDRTGQNILASSPAWGNGTDESINFNVTSPDYFYLKVVPFLSSSYQPYEIRLTDYGFGLGGFPVSFDDGIPYGGYYSEFSGDMLGASINLPSYPMIVERVYIYFTNTDVLGNGEGWFYLLLYDNYGFILDPETLGALRPVSTGWSYLDLAGQDIRAYSNIFVGILFDGTSTPSIGYDNFASGRDYYFDANSQTWTFLNESLFIRLDVRYPNDMDYLCGDTDGNGIVNITDAAYYVNYLFVAPTPPAPGRKGDVDCNGIITITDAVYMINYIFLSGPAPCDYCP